MSHHTSSYLSRNVRSASLNPSFLYRAMAGLCGVVVFRTSVRNPWTRHQSIAVRIRRVQGNRILINISFGQPAVPTPQEGGFQTRPYGRPMFQSRSRQNAIALQAGPYPLAPHVIRNSQPTELRDVIPQAPFAAQGQVGRHWRQGCGACYLNSADDSILAVCRRHGGYPARRGALRDIMRC